MLKNYKIKILSVFFLLLFGTIFLFGLTLLSFFDLLLKFKLEMFGFFLSGIAFKVITVPNPVFSVLYLVLLFLIGSIFCLSIGLEYMGLVLLIVYVGAIAVLFLFVIMMLDIKVTNKTGISSLSYRFKQFAIAISIPVLGAFYGLIKFLLDVFIPNTIVFWVNHALYFNFFDLYYDSFRETVFLVYDHILNFLSFFFRKFV